MKQRGTCGLTTDDGTPCKNPPGCRVRHSSATAQDTTEARLAVREAMSSSESEVHADPPQVRIEHPDFALPSAQAPEHVWREWVEADRELWGGMRRRDADDGVAAAALDAIRRSDDVIRRLAEEQAIWANERGLPGDVADEQAARWTKATLALRDAAIGPRPASAAAVTLDYGFWPRSDPDDTRLRDPSGANCELESEDGKKTLDIEGLYQGKVTLNLLRHGSGWMHDHDVEVAWDLTEDEARLLVSELAHRFGWD